MYDRYLSKRALDPVLNRTVYNNKIRKNSGRFSGNLPIRLNLKSFRGYFTTICQDNGPPQTVSDYGLNSPRRMMIYNF